MAGGPYNIPRNTKGESRFFYIFSVRALIFTGVLGGMGFVLFYFIGSLFKYTFLGTIMGVLFGLIGFAIASFKIPESNNFEITRNARRRIYLPNNNEIY